MSIYEAMPALIPCSCGQPALYSNDFYPPGVFVYCAACGRHTSAEGYEKYGVDFTVSEWSKAKALHAVIRRWNTGVLE
jgi:hypothetical protein